MLNFAIKSVWILADNKVQDKIGHEDYGMYAALFSLGFLFIAFSDLGLNQYATKTLANSPDQLKKLFPNLFTLKIILSIIYPIFMVIVGWVLGYSRHQLYLLSILCVTQSVTQLIFFFRSNFQAFQRFAIDAVASVMDKALLLVIVLILLFVKIDLELYVYARLISAGLALVILFGFVLNIFGFIKPGLNKEIVKSLLRKSFPFAIITILYSVNDKVDQVMLERIAGAKETGLYAGAYRWVDAVMMYLWTVLPIFFARFAFHLNDTKAQQKLLKFGQGIAAIPMIYIAVFVFFYSEKLLFLFKNTDPADLHTMQLCMIALFSAVIINGLFAIYSTLLTSTNHERFVSIMIAVSIVMNITLNFIFIPQYGAVASAWNTVASYALLSVSYLIYIQFKMQLNLPWLQLGKTILAGLIFTGVFYLLDSLGIFEWWMVAGISGIVLLGLTFALGLISLKKEVEES